VSKKCFQEFFWNGRFNLRHSFMHRSLNNNKINSKGSKLKTFGMSCERKKHVKKHVHTWKNMYIHTWTQGLECRQTVFKCPKWFRLSWIPRKRSKFSTYCISVIAQLNWINFETANLATPKKFETANLATPKSSVRPSDYKLHNTQHPWPTRHLPAFQSGKRFVKVDYVIKTWEWPSVCRSIRVCE
jgi:hypothetical protein